MNISPASTICIKIAPAEITKNHFQSFKMTHLERQRINSSH